MPIRTDRGRVAVYRKIWGWPLRSPRNLVVTVTVAAVLGIGIALLAAAISTTSSTPTNAAAAASSTTRPPATTPETTSRPAPSTSMEDSSSANTPAVTTPFPTTSVSPSTGPAPTGTELAKVVAGEFMARWVHHPAGITSKQWAAQLTPYVVPEFVVLLESVDPANIPATTVTGDPVVTAESASVVEVNVSTDGGVLHLVLLAQPDGTWLVRSYDMAG